MKAPRQLRRLLPYLARHRRRLLGGLACLLVTTGLSVLSPWVLRYAVDDLTRSGLAMATLLYYAGAIVAIVAVEGGFRYGMRMILIGISRAIEYELRQDIYTHLTRLDARYYQGSRTGDLMSRATNDLSAVRMVLGPGIMYTASTLATTAGTVALMLTISPRLLLLALVPLLVVAFLVRYFGRRIHERFEAVQEQLSNLSALVQENLAGARVVRAYAQEEHELSRFREANLEYVRRNRALIRMFGSLYPGIQLLMGTGAVLVLWLGGGMVVKGTITLGEFVAFGAYLTMLHWPMIALGWVVNLFERGDASMGRIGEILDVQPQIRDHDPLPLAAAQGHLSFRGLSFAYDGKVVLDDISLDVPAGRTVAVVGPTGAGKSTLVSLLARLHEPPAGTLLVDGHDVRRVPLSVLRAAIGMVPQETFLFSDTVAENIGFGLAADAPDRRARIEWAAEVAQLGPDVAEFPDGYETFVGERGITLSGGQKQRVALARALAKDPRILVLDDALSAVDTYTEEKILEGLRSVMATRTTFLVSHRISTVRQADLIVVLRAGRIVERGTHDELAARGGFYADLHRKQLLEEEVLRTA